MKTPYIIYGLPRSRTFWLSRALSYGEWDCGHDEIRHARSMEDLKAWFAQPNIGTVETAAAPFWRLLPELHGGVRTFVVRRPVEQVVASLMALPIPFDRARVEIAMRRADQKLDQIERRVPGAVSIPFDDLATEAGFARVFESCLPYQHDGAWWRAMDALNLQTNLATTIKYLRAHETQVTKLAKMAKQRVVAGMATPIRSVDGITIQQEPFATWYEDAQKLFGNHLVLVGEAPDAYSEKNVPLMQKLDDLGCMQITTARCNGRMFGYLMVIISPSLESRDRHWGVNTTFYASPEIRGLGMKLQRASLAALDARGVQETIWRAGVRGDGPRMAAMYRRLGAVPDGEMFRRELRVA